MELDELKPTPQKLAGRQTNRHGWAWARMGSQSGVGQLLVEKPCKAPCAAQYRAPYLESLTIGAFRRLQHLRVQKRELSLAHRASSRPSHLIDDREMPRVASHR